MKTVWWANIFIWIYLVPLQGLRGEKRVSPSRIRSGLDTGTSLPASLPPSVQFFPKLNFASLLSRTSVESDTSWLHPFDALYSLSLAPLVRSQSFNLPREGGRIPHDLAHRNHDFTRLTEVAFAVTSLMWMKCASKVQLIRVLDPGSLWCNQKSSSGGINSGDVQIHNLFVCYTGHISM